MTDEKIITLIGNKQAKIGYKFLHLGHLKQCEECKLFQVCMKNLKPDREYEVIEVRPKKHECLIHEDGVTVVGVKERAIKTLLPGKIAFEGAKITFHPNTCNNMDCEFYKLCNVNIKEGEKCRIEEIDSQKKIKCENNLKLRLVKLKIL